MAKRVKKVVKLQLQAGKATPAPPVGTALGPTGVNLAKVCKDYNDMTKNWASLVIPVVVTIFEDATYTLQLKTSPTSVLIKQAAGVVKGARKTKSEVVGSITEEQLRDIAETKMPDLNAASIEAAMSMVEGTAKSMGIRIER